MIKNKKTKRGEGFVVEYEIEYGISVDQPPVECWFDVEIGNGLLLHSFIPLNNGRGSHYFVKDPSVNVDFIDYIEFYLNEHFEKKKGKYQGKCPYTVAYIKSCFI